MYIYIYVYIYIYRMISDNIHTVYRFSTYELSNWEAFPHLPTPPFPPRPSVAHAHCRHQGRQRRRRSCSHRHRKHGRIRRRGEWFIGGPEGSRGGPRFVNGARAVVWDRMAQDSMKWKAITLWNIWICISHVHIYNVVLPSYKLVYNPHQL